MGDCIGGVLATCSGVLVPDLDIGVDAIAVSVSGSDIGMGGVVCPME